MMNIPCNKAAICRHSRLDIAAFKRMFYIITRLVF